MTPFEPSPEAIEAAARALSSSTNPDLNWDTCDQYYQSDIRLDARAALTAAAPFIEAQAKAEAWDEGYGDCWTYHRSEGSQCLCGFASARSRSRTERITGLVRAATIESEAL